MNKDHSSALVLVILGSLLAIALVVLLVHIVAPIIDAGIVIGGL